MPIGETPRAGLVFLVLMHEFRLLILLFLFHIRLLTFLVALSGIIFFIILEQVGFSLSVFFRWLRCQIAGIRRKLSYSFGGNNKDGIKTGLTSDRKSAQCQFYL